MSITRDKKLLEDKQLVETVAEDLIHLKNDWNDSVEDDVLRRSSPVLRRLLVDKELPRALRAVGLPSQAIIDTSTLEPTLQLAPLDKIYFASAGGAKCKGNEFRGPFIVNFKMSTKEKAKHKNLGVPKASMPIHDFVEAPCIVAYGTLIPRRILIQYIANKLGGAHLDPKRLKGEKEFISLDRARRDENLMYPLQKLIGKPLIYYELLSIGQSLSSSSDIETFLKKVGKL